MPLVVNGPGTIDDLVEDSHRLGYPMTERAIRDWIERGLIDNAQRGRALGRGSGSERGQFSENQRRLFQELIPHRIKGVSPKVLANTPVWLWLYFGDDYASVGQVRRAMHTWAPTPRMSVRHAESAANDLIALYASPTASQTARNAARRLVVETATRARVNPSELERAIRAICDPDSVGRPGALPAVRQFIDHVQWRIKTVRDLPNITDDEYYSARLQHRTHWTMYVGARTQLRADAPEHLKHLHDEPTIDDIVGDACSNLLAMLALERQREQDRE